MKFDPGNNPRVTPVVIGSLFGDEGKGRFTSDLCKGFDAVLRYSGGQQAGHTYVHPDGRRFVFSSLASGTPHGCVTVIGPFTTWEPSAMLKEIKRFEATFPDLPKPRVCVLSGLMSTVFDGLACQALEFVRRGGTGTDSIKGHGSCGHGIWATIRRYNANYSSSGFELDFHASVERGAIKFDIRSALKAREDQHLFLTRECFSEENRRPEDLIFWWKNNSYLSQEVPHRDPEILRRDALLSQARAIYTQWSSFPIQAYYDETRAALDQLQEHYFVPYEDEDEEGMTAPLGAIFCESSQGLALDPSLITSPHVTATRVGLGQASITLDKLEREFVFQPIYALRTFRTRHGAGPMNVAPENHGAPAFDYSKIEESTIALDPLRIPNDLTNVTNPHQGGFRVAALDIDQVAAFIKADVISTEGLGAGDLTPVLAVSHLDVFTANNTRMPYILDGRRTHLNETEFLSILEERTGFKVEFTSSSATTQA